MLEKTAKRDGYDLIGASRLKQRMREFEKKNWRVVRRHADASKAADKNMEGSDASGRQELEKVRQRKGTRYESRMMNTPVQGRE